MDSEYRYQAHAVAFYVTPVAGGRWDIRSSTQGQRPYAFVSREVALKVAREVAGSQWERWGFPAVVYVREGDDDPWIVESYFGQTQPDDVTERAWATRALPRRARDP